MNHVDYTPGVLGRKSSTPSEWLPLGRQITELVNAWSNRNDIVAFVGPGAGGKTAAFFTPATAEMELSIPMAFGTSVSPEDIGNMHEKKTQYAWAKATGCVFHEAMHARYSLWDLAKAADDLNELQHSTLILFEESRVESRALTVAPEYVNFLRASALELAIDDAAEQFTQNSTTRSAGMLVALVHSRVEAGILAQSDVQAVYDVCEDWLGNERIAKLCAILEKTRAHALDSDITPLYPLVDEWIDILKDAAEEHGETLNDKPKAALIAALSEALSEAADIVSVGCVGDLNEQESLEDEKTKLAERYKAGKEQADHKGESVKVFAKPSGPGASATASRLESARKPTAAERTAAVIIGNALEKAKYRERDITVSASQLPPGRLHTRTVVQGAAQKLAGVRNPVTPWRKTVRKHTDDPTLSVGVMVDISGSMGSAMNPMATTAWIMSEAAHRVQARYAQVYFGNDVFYSSKPLAREYEVNTYTANDSTEKFDKAFKALDGSLNLLHGTGARMLVVVSDGEYIPAERECAIKWMKACKEAGVAVIWIPFDTYSASRALALQADGAVVQSNNIEVEHTAKEIGMAASKLMAKIGIRNSAA
jgi:hypothetical protein